jgi:hypothetical protein
LTIECIKDRNTAATCALCLGSHPANYKGCAIYKEIQNRKFPQLREKIIESKPKPNRNQTDLSRPVNSSISFAQITKGINNQYANQRSQYSNNKQRNVENNNQPEQPNQYSDNEQRYVNDNNQSEQPKPTQQTNKLEQMMEKLMERMDTMLNLLTTLVSKIK